MTWDECVKELEAALILLGIDEDDMAFSSKIHPNGGLFDFRSPCGRWMQTDYREATGESLEEYRSRVIGIMVERLKGNEQEGNNES